MDDLRQIPPSHPPTLIPSPNGGTKKKSRLSYSINFKLAAVRHAETHGNRATARYLGINEKQIRDWRSKKSSLMNTNANAKRLKGAGRQSSGADQNRRAKTFTKKPLDDTNKPFNWLQPPLPTREFFENNKHFSFWHEWSSRDNGVSMVNNVKELPTVNNNNNDYTTTSKHYVKNPTMKSFSCVGKNEEQTNEKDYKEKISCALALLELKSTSKHPYRYPLVSW